MSDSKTFLITSCVGFSIILIAFVSSLTYYSAHSYQKQIPDTKSLNKIDQINNIFISLFGNNWFFVILLFTVLFIFLIMSLYTISKNGINININDDKYNKFFIVFIIFMIIFSGCMISMAIKSFTSKDVVSDPNLQNYIPIIDYNRNSQILEIIGLSVFIIISIIAAVWYFRRKPS